MCDRVEAKQNMVMLNISISFCEIVVGKKIHLGKKIRNYRLYIVLHTDSQ